MRFDRLEIWMDDTIVLSENCRLCSSSEVTNVLKLTPTPPGDRFVAESTRGRWRECYPLELAICEDCGYLHLRHILNPSMSYNDALYHTKITMGLNDHYVEYAEELLKRFEFGPRVFVVDLGSNDGTCLKAFKSLGCDVLGVEPNSTIAAEANALVPTRNTYFDTRCVDDIIREYGTASIITANYMFANIEDVNTFVTNLARLLSEDGILSIQTGYHPDQMKIRMFDYIYHEHFSYFTVKVLRDLLAKVELECIHVSSMDFKGGSIRLIAQKKQGKRAVASSVQEYVDKEEDEGFHSLQKYRDFSDEIERYKMKTLIRVKELHVAGKRIVGYGASHSTTTLLYHFELGDYLEYIVDDNVAKHGLYSPGYERKVFPSQMLLEDQPDYVVILAWQYQKPILARNCEYLNIGGSFIVPLPEFEIVSGATLENV